MSSTDITTKEETQEEFAITNVSPTNNTIKEETQEVSAIIVSPTNNTTIEETHEEIRLENYDSDSNNDIVVSIDKTNVAYNPDTRVRTSFFEVTLSPTKHTSPTKEGMDKDQQIEELKRQLDQLQTARLVIKTQLEKEADEELREKKQQVVNDTKKRIEKNQSTSIHDAKKNLAKSFKESETKGKTTRKPAAKNPLVDIKNKSSSKEKVVGAMKIPTNTNINFEPIAPIEVAKDVSLTEVEQDGMIPQAEVKKYEIQPKLTGPYCNESLTTTREEGKEDEEENIVMITNHQKEYGKEGDFMMMFESGYRMWSPASLTHRDCKLYECEEMLTMYMTENNVTFEMMGYVEKKRKQKSIYVPTNDAVPTLISCVSLHNKFICFDEETNAAYANTNQFYFGVKCRECTRYFCNKQTKIMCNGKQ